SVAASAVLTRSAPRERPDGSAAGGLLWLTIGRFVVTNRGLSVNRTLSALVWTAVTPGLQCPSTGSCWRLEQRMTLSCGPPPASRRTPVPSGGAEDGGGP